MSSVKRLGRPTVYPLDGRRRQGIYDNVGVPVRIHEDAPLSRVESCPQARQLQYQNLSSQRHPSPHAGAVYDGSRRPRAECGRSRPGWRGKTFWLQSKLKELGYYHGTVTGTFLDGTKEAVKAFQREHKLKVNGTADVKTLEFLPARRPDHNARADAAPHGPAFDCIEGNGPAPLVSYVVDTAGIEREC